MRDTIIGTFHETCRKLGNESIASKIENSFIGAYNNIKSQDLSTLKQAFVFLKKCGLISITPIARELDAVPNVYRSMKLDKSDIDCKKDLFKKFNITIDYTMFYVQILKDVLKEDMPPQLSGTLLGSIVECHARGLLPDGFEYKTTINKNGIETECEIDYINLFNNISVEFLIGVSHNKYFEILPDYMKNVCLTRNENKIFNGIEFVDYCSYLFSLSQKRYLSLNAAEENCVKQQENSVQVAAVITGEAITKTVSQKSHAAEDSQMPSSWEDSAIRAQSQTDVHANDLQSQQQSSKKEAAQKSVEQQKKAKKLSENSAMCVNADDDLDDIPKNWKDTWLRDQEKKSEMFFSWQ